MLLFYSIPLPIHAPYLSCSADHLNSPNNSIHYFRYDLISNSIYIQVMFCLSVKFSALLWTSVTRQRIVRYKSVSLRVKKVASLPDRINYSVQVQELFNANNKHIKALMSYFYMFGKFIWIQWVFPCLRSAHYNFVDCLNPIFRRNWCL